MDIPADSIGTIIGALIVAAISLVSLLIAKDQKTTEFRQAWIDRLRDDVAEFLSYHSMMKYQIQLKDPKVKNSREFRVETFESLKDEIVKMERVYAAILLRLNPKEHGHIVVKIDEIKELYTKSEILSEGIMDAHETELLKLFQTELKKEWTRVKTGELAFRLTKYIAVTLVIIGITIVVLDYSEKFNLSQLISNKQLQTDPAKAGPLN